MTDNPYSQNKIDIPAGTVAGAAAAAAAASQREVEASRVAEKGALGGAAAATAQREVGASKIAESVIGGVAAATASGMFAKEQLEAGAKANEIIGKHAGSLPNTLKGSEKQTTPDLPSLKLEEKDSIDKALEKVFEKALKKTSETVSAKEGVNELLTGDVLIKAPGKDHLVAPDRSTITANKDGSIDVTSKQPVHISIKDGKTTVSYKNGDSVEIKDGAITSVSRNGQTSTIVNPESGWGAEKIKPLIDNGHLIPGYNTLEIFKTPAPKESNIEPMKKTKDQ